MKASVRASTQSKSVTPEKRGVRTPSPSKTTNQRLGYGVINGSEGAGLCRGMYLPAKSFSGMPEQQGLPRTKTCTYGYIIQYIVNKVHACVVIRVDWVGLGSVESPRLVQTLESPGIQPRIQPPLCIQCVLRSTYVLDTALHQYTQPRHHD